jgi:hypothetical protein
MYAINAENENSPLIKAGSNVFKMSHERKILDGINNKKKQYPEFKYVRNSESPIYLNDNRNFDFYNRKMKGSGESYGNAQASLINQSIDSLNRNMNGNYNIIYNNVDNSKEMGKYMDKFTKRMKNVINITSDVNHSNSTGKNEKISNFNNLYSNDNLIRNNSNISESLNHKNEYLRKNFDHSYSKIKDKQSYDSSSYLMNINDYNIKENDKVNEDRILKYNKKKVEEYNCIVGKRVSLSPPKFSVDKWPLFYEK